MDSFLCFAYGSNMLTERLTARCPSAHAVFNAQAREYRLTFSKKSVDGSGKGHMERASEPNSSVEGVVFEIPVGERPYLDEAEGRDYRRDDDFQVQRIDTGEAVTVSVYVAKEEARDAALRPYDWYRDLIVEGAKQHALQENYVAWLQSLPADADPKPKREARLHAIRLLNKRWEETLGKEDRTVLAVAQKVYLALPMEGVCYRASFFLRYHLKTQFGIDGMARVGFVNDGTDDLFASHAWYEFGGRITDLAISRPLDPTLQRPGPLVILGREFQPGWKWTYHTERSEAAKRIIDGLLADRETRYHIGQAEKLHKMMSAVAQQDDRIRTYLDGAPDGMTYEVLKNRVKIVGQ